MEAILLRPHHVLDIVTDYKPDEDPAYKRAPGENNVRTLARRMGQSLDIEARFVVGPDFICAPCSHLRPDGSCDRILERHDPPEAMDHYNNPLDRRVLGYLSIAPGTVMTIRAFLEAVNERVPGIEDICTHPGQQRSARLAGLISGLIALGVRPPALHADAEAGSGQS